MSFQRFWGIRSLDPCNRRHLYSAFGGTVRATVTLRLALILGLTACAFESDIRLHAQAGARERTIFVSALDTRGEPVDGLGPGDFIIRENGQRREVLRVSRAIE